LEAGSSPGEAPALEANAPWERMEEAAREEGSIAPWEWEEVVGGLEGVTFWPMVGLLVGAMVQVVVMLVGWFEFTLVE